MSVRIKKRDGSVVDFNTDKIKKAVSKAFVSTKSNRYNENFIDLISNEISLQVRDRITKDFPNHFSEDFYLDIETIQDMVENELLKFSSQNETDLEIAKNYVKYRYKRELARNDKKLLVDADDTMGGYLKQSDWRVNENSNVSYSIGGLILHNSSTITANYWLKNVYTPEIASAHNNASIHIHDLGFYGGYCFTGDTLIKTIDEEGKIVLKSFFELVENNTKKLKVISYDTTKHPTFPSSNNRPIVIADAIDPRITRTVTELCYITFETDSNKEVDAFKCSVDNRWLLRNNTYKNSVDLKPGDICMCDSYPQIGGTVRNVYVKQLDQPVNLYDITVEKYHNYALHNGVFVHNCAGWSIKQLLEEGLGGVEDKITSSPAHHLSTAVQQIVNFLGIMQNEWAGAQALSSFDTYLAPFIKKDNMSRKEVKQCIQTFLFGVNTPSRWGEQAPFSNITLDWVCPKDMKDLNPVIGGEVQPFTYGDCQAEMDLFNELYIDLMVQGDSLGRGFQYPIPTYNITSDFVWDSPNANKLFEMTAKYGTPYFQNFVNSDLDPSAIRSMCCRLQLDLRELTKRGGGLFGANEFTGSIGVVTINLPQIAYLTKKEISDGSETELKNKFFEKLEKMMDLAKESLELKRKTVVHHYNSGLFIYTKRYLSHYKNHFSTIGLNGANEACINLFDKETTIATEKGRDFSIEVLNFMLEKIRSYQEETGNLYNLEASPAESVSYRFARHDKKNYPNIITSGKSSSLDDVFYTNSTQLPVDHTKDVFEALDLQEPLQTVYNGGTVFHTFLGQRISSAEACKKLVKTIVYNYKIPYLSISPTYSICSKHGYLSGEQKECPICKKEKENEILVKIKQLEEMREKTVESLEEIKNDN